MPTYAQFWRANEDRIGETRLVFVVSDAISTLHTPLESLVAVDVFDIEETNEDLDKGTGQPVLDDLTFHFADTSVESGDDADAIQFIKDAQLGQARYVALFVNPSDTPTVGERAFFGKVDSKQSATDVHWMGSEYGTAIDPIQQWTAKAFSQEAEVWFDVDLKEAVEAISGGWRAAHVADRLGYYKHTVGGGELESRNTDGTWSGTFPSSDNSHQFEARHHAMAQAFDVITELLSSAAVLSGAGISVTFDPCYTTYHAAPAWYCVNRETRYTHYDPLPRASEIRTRYVGSSDAAMLPPGSPPPASWVNDGSTARLCLTGGMANGSVTVGGHTFEASELMVTWNLLQPGTTENAAGSWVARYKKVGELIYAIATALDCVVGLTYDTPTDCRVTFTPLQTLADNPTGTLYLRDATEASLEIGEVNKEKPFVANTWAVNREGGAPDPLLINYHAGRPVGLVVPDYVYDIAGGLRAIDQSGLPYKDDAGQHLALSISPTCAVIQERATDWYQRPATRLMPHNTVKYKDGSAQDAERNVHRTAGVTTGMYMLRTGRPDTDPGVQTGLFLYATGTYGVDGLVCTVPVAFIRQRIYSPQVSDYVELPFFGLADYLTAKRGVQAGYYEQERSVTVPWLSAFRQTSGGVDHWRNARIGASVILDGVEYRLVGLRRAWKDVRTELKLHAATRFEAPPPASVAAEGAQVSEAQGSAGSPQALIDTNELFGVRLGAPGDGCATGTAYEYELDARTGGSCTWFDLVYDRVTDANDQFYLVTTPDPITLPPPIGAQAWIETAWDGDYEFWAKITLAVAIDQPTPWSPVLWTAPATTAQVPDVSLQLWHAPDQSSPFVLVAELDREPAKPLEMHSTWRGKKSLRLYGRYGNLSGAVNGSGAGRVKFRLVLRNTGSNAKIAIIDSWAESIRLKRA